MIYLNNCQPGVIVPPGDTWQYLEPSLVAGWGGAVYYPHPVGRRQRYC